MGIKRASILRTRFFSTSPRSSGPSERTYGGGWRFAEGGPAAHWEQKLPSRYDLVSAFSSSRSGLPSFDLRLEKTIFVCRKTGVARLDVQRKGKRGGKKSRDL
jgi:hypothetical protein